MILHGRTGDLPSFQIFNQGIDILTHQVELVKGLFVGMHRDLGGWQCEDEPAIAYVNMPEFEDLPEELAVSVCVFRINNYMGTVDHSIGYKVPGSWFLVPG